MPRIWRRMETGWKSWNAAQSRRTNIGGWFGWYTRQKVSDLSATVLILMIQLQSIVDVADNTGAKQVMIFRVLRGSTSRRGKLRLQSQIWCCSPELSHFCPSECLVISPLWGDRGTFIFSGRRWQPTPPTRACVGNWTQLGVQESSQNKSRSCEQKHSFYGTKIPAFLPRWEPIKGQICTQSPMTGVP